MDDAQSALLAWVHRWRRRRPRIPRAAFRGLRYQLCAGGTQR
ncbi:hypothetical protein ACLK2H_12970 [Escherichia coli]